MHKSTFDYLAPTGKQMERIDRVRAAAKAFCDALDEVVPDGPDKTYLIRKIREAAMWANVSITRTADGMPRE